jgi:hypothetical protein
VSVLTPMGLKSCLTVKRILNSYVLWNILIFNNSWAEEMVPYVLTIGVLFGLQTVLRYVAFPANRYLHAKTL